MRGINACCASAKIKGTPFSVCVFFFLLKQEKGQNIRMFGVNAYYQRANQGDTSSSFIKSMRANLLSEDASEGYATGFAPA